MFELITKEFILIVDTLSTTHDIENDRIVVDKEYFKKLLEKYKYMSFKEKTKVYKDLNLIFHDKNSYTLPCRSNSKTVRKVVINYNAYLTLKKLMQEEV